MPRLFSIVARNWRQGRSCQAPLSGSQKGTIDNRKLCLGVYGGKMLRGKGSTKDGSEGDLEPAP